MARRDSCKNRRGSPGLRSTRQVISLVRVCERTPESFGWLGVTVEPMVGKGGPGPGLGTGVGVLADDLRNGDLVLGVELGDSSLLSRDMLGIIAPGVVVGDAIEDDDGHSFPVVSGEGREVHESRHCPCPALHVVGQLVVPQRGGFPAQS